MKRNSSTRRSERSRAKDCGKSRSICHPRATLFDWTHKACLLVVLALTGSWGCRGASQRQELLERELRHQEDRIYQLEEHLADCKAQLDGCQQGSTTIRTPAGATIIDVPRASNELSPPTVQLGAPEQAPPFSGPPQISPPNPNVPEGTWTTPKTSTPAHSNDGFKPPVVELPTLEPPRTSTEPPPSSPPSMTPPANQGTDTTPADEADIAAITLNGELTGGYNADDRPGDEGVTVFVEPRSSSGRVARSSGKVSVVLMDPAQQGDAARVARWNFTAEEAARHFRRTPTGDGLHLQLRWPNEAPAHSDLSLHVRYITEDGRKLDIEKPIHVDLPSQQASRAWIRAVKPAPSARGVSTIPLLRKSPSENSSAEPLREARQLGTKWAPYR
jgi:hypothetical protein